MPQYEVWCHRCNVTFPVGTRVCMHCGGRTRAEPPPRSRFAASEPRLKLGDPRSYAETGEMQRFELPVAQDESVEEEPMRRSMLRAGMTLLWMILLAAGYAWRTCSPQSQ